MGGASGNGGTRQKFSRRCEIRFAATVIGCWHVVPEFKHRRLARTHVWLPGLLRLVGAVLPPIAPSVARAGESTQVVHKRPGDPVR